MEKSDKPYGYAVSISKEGVIKESLEFKLEVYHAKQLLNLNESIRDHRTGKAHFSETLRKNEIYCERLELVGRIKSNWYSVSPEYKTDQQIRNENLGYELGN